MTEMLSAKNLRRLRRRTMTRIYWEFTKLTFSQYPDYLMVLIFAAAVFTMISFSNVIANMPKESLALAYNFLVSAFLRTSWVIQVLIVGFFLRLITWAILFAYNRINLKKISRDFQKFKLKALKTQFRYGE